MINHLKAPRVINEEGIFRITGTHSVILSLRQSIDDGIDINFDSVNPHDLAGLFKKYLRELPSPLLTFPLFYSLIANDRLYFPFPLPLSPPLSLSPSPFPFSPLFLFPSLSPVFLFPFPYM